MKIEEKPKVLIDLDKYQKLLEKANLNDKTIQQFKDAAYNEGYKKGYNRGNDLCQLAVRQECSELQKTLDDFLKTFLVVLCLAFYAFVLIVPSEIRLSLM